jgi:hypothetical protein
MAAGIVFRAAAPADAYALAELSIMAGDGIYEFLLEEMAPREMLAGLMARSMKQDAGGFSWRHCFVADDKGVVGMINAFPAAWLREEERDILPQDRVQILDPIDQAQDWESFLVNSVAVRPQHRAHEDGHRAGQGGSLRPPQRECVGRQRCRSRPLRETGLCRADAGRSTAAPRPGAHRRELVDGTADRRGLIHIRGTASDTLVEHFLGDTHYRHGRGIACFFMADKLCT